MRLSRSGGLVVGRVTIKPFWRWFDIWIGAYVDTERRAVYICPLPMVGVKVTWGRR